MRVLLVLAQGFEDLEAVSVVDVMGWTEYREWVPTVEVVTAGFGETVRSRFGLAVQPDLQIDAVDAGDFQALAIPGGFHSHGFDEAYDDRLRQLARAVHSAGGWIATLCVGVLPVAEAGLLRGRRAVSYPHSRHHNNLGRLRELGAQVIDDERVVVDNRIISCAGPASSLEVAYRLLEALVGPEHGAEVRRLMCDNLPIDKGEVDVQDQTHR
jgi:4-methyl-5(b-hydroxyethyl)-thiazole monophosphate biosynthesis